MTPKCIQAVQVAAGRALTATELQKIDDSISANMRRLAVADPQRWRGLTLEQRMLEATSKGMEEIQTQAVRKLENAQRQLLKAAETAGRVEALKQAYGSGRNAALVRDMENTQKYVDGIKAESVSGLMDLMEAGKSGQGLGLGRRTLQVLFDADNPQMSRDLAVEIFANAKGSTGNTLAQKGAQAWLDAIESMRTRFNGAGGEVRKLNMAICRSHMIRCAY
jgi:hypothetical protein